MDESMLNILLVEDNEDHAELIMRSLEDQQIKSHVFHVTDGEQALDYLFHRGEYSQVEKYPRPNLILLDLRLPKVDGLGVLKEIKQAEELRIIPTVVLTSSESENDIYRAYNYYANSFLVKPMDFQQFNELMLKLGRYWLKCNANPVRLIKIIGE